MTGVVPSSFATRSRDPEGLRWMMMAVSSVAHAAAIAALVTASGVLDPHHRTAQALAPIGVPAAPGAVWTDLLAPQRDVEKPSPTPAVRKPSSSTKLVPAPATPAAAPEVRPASPPVGTGPASSEGGLSTGALPGTNALSAGVDFCDPAYLGQMIALIHRSWQQNQNVAGTPIVRFAIQRDGTLTEITLRQPSGYPALDLAALRAVMLTRAIPPLPACYPHPHYAMNLTFEYIR